MDGNEFPSARQKRSSVPLLYVTGDVRDEPSDVPAFGKVVGLTLVATGVVLAVGAILAAGFCKAFSLWN